MKPTTIATMLCAALLLPACAAATQCDDRVLFYYGWPSSFNYPTNFWNPSLVAQDMSQYDMVVLGAGLESPTHPDHVNTMNIVSHISGDVYGYVTLNQPAATTQTKISQWDAMGADGIFIDEAGYDFGKNRVQFNTIVNYVHSRTNANVVFVNAWNPDHVMGAANDASYPNTVYNPLLAQSALTATDYYLLESCPVYHNVYRMTDYDVAKCTKCVALRNAYGVNLVSVSTIGNTCPTGQTLYNQHEAVTQLHRFDVHGTSDLWYGAGSSQVKMWT